MAIRVSEEPLDALGQHAGIPIRFTVTHRVDLASLASPHTQPLRVLPHPKPYLKDYDALPGNLPADWTGWLDPSHWGLLAAYAERERVGGALIGCPGQAMSLLPHQALLWDIRVRPGARRQGIGGKLLRASEAWAVARGCRELQVETQDINVPACQFYRGQGYQVQHVEPDAYPDCPGEARLVWARTLAHQPLDRLDEREKP